MVDLRNRKVITASLAGVAVVAVSVGVGLGVTRGKNKVGVDGEPPVADSAPDVADYSPGPLVEKESFLRHDEPKDVLDEISEADETVEEESDRAAPRVSVSYKNQWGGGSKSSKGGPWKCGSSSSSWSSSSSSSSSKAWKGAESWSADPPVAKGSSATKKSHPSGSEKSKPSGSEKPKPSGSEKSKPSGSVDHPSIKGTVKESEAKGAAPKEPKGRRRCKFVPFAYFLLL